ncbi:hypothetical protein D3C84_620860 [compost metagenome]|jgi:hypothetical protein
MYLNLDTPLIGFWLLLTCPWIVGRRSLHTSVYATVLALALSAVLALGGALLMGIITWTPKWPDQAWLWMLNNLLLVTLVEEALFRGYIQGGLSRFMKTPRPAAGVSDLRPGPRRGWLAMGGTGESGRGRLRPRLPFRWIGRSHPQPLRLEPDALRTVHLPDGGIVTATNQTTV